MEPEELRQKRAELMAAGDMLAWLVTYGKLSDVVAQAEKYKRIDGEYRAVQDKFLERVRRG